MNRATLIICAVVAAILFSLSWAVDHYRSNSIAYKEQRDAANTKLSQANATINDIQTRQRDVESLDAKYTKELADAQKTIGDLRRDVDSGAKRLRVAATCPVVRKTTTTGSVGDATGPRLTDSAERDYFTLRERINTITGQVKYLQDYIRQQCQK
ncbi:lysis protein [Rahnella variigena]|uniref:lysis protein n=1 Tax=Rahnella variigena TaxID=574964 RepID=UPI00133036D4|nr:lysis protein [Rahnella variigena]